eukprot:TRINITY_DN6632_c0_g1_i1.p1 TRINITY_DN6632_c0_g1~~TRINITY_DN6632_c0_g1_i1.p1  ORF type:complete len:307 (+),score=55.28 TRINITY_DN6632_c0_g1_i1:196-1116(+)
MQRKVEPAGDPFLQRFILGGISCMTPLAVVNPIEVVKTRLQLQGEGGGAERKYRGLLHTLVRIAREEGVRGLYKGVAPSAVREFAYAGLRLALYEPIKKVLGEDPATGQLSFGKKLVAGSAAGSIGAALANPTDLVKVRMQAEGALAPGQKPLYSGVVNAWISIARQDGLLGLYKGVLPTTQRAAVISAAMMPVYDQTKHFLQRHELVQRESFAAHFISGLTAGFCMTVVTSPIDVVKTRLMRQASAGGSVVYRGMIDCLYKTWRTEGVLGLYKGFVPNVSRLGPHTCLALMCFEQLRRIAGIKPV